MNAADVTRLVEIRAELDGRMVHAEINRLQRLLDTAREDTERLDWLSQIRRPNGRGHALWSIRFGMSGGSHCGYQASEYFSLDVSVPMKVVRMTTFPATPLASNFPGHESMTFREAIDAARAPEGDSHE